MADTRTDPSSNRRADSDRGLSPAMDLGSTAAVALSALASLLSYGALPPRLRIHWTLGAGPYYGPEFAPTGAVIVAFPVVVAMTAAVGRGTVRRARADGRAGRPYDAALLVGPAGLVAIQVGLFVANL